MDTGIYPSVNDCLYHLLDGFQKVNASGFYGNFRYYYQDGTNQLLEYIPYAPHVLNYVNQTHPPLSPRGGLQALPRVSLTQQFLKAPCVGGCFRLH